MPLVVLYNSSFCIPLFIYLPRYFEIPAATLKSLPRLSGLLGELPGNNLLTCLEKFIRLVKTTIEYG